MIDSLTRPDPNQIRSWLADVPDPEVPAAKPGMRKEADEREALTGRTAGRP